MKPVPYWHVDAFAGAIFGGNQAAVLIFDKWPNDRVLQAIAAENMFANTGFLVPEADGPADYALRWFAPACEVRLCGHATMASGHVLFQRDGGERLTFRTRWAGLMEMHRLEEGCYEMALPLIHTQQQRFPEAESALGVEPLEVWRNPDGYNLFLYRSEEEIRSLKPDFAGLAELGTDSFTCTARGEKTDVVSRVFVPGAGVDEDSVTGSAHAVMAPVWARKLGRDRFTAYQASKRGGLLSCRLEGERVWLSGRCITVVEGVFYLSG